MDEEVSEVVDLVHSLVLQSRPPPGPMDEALSRAPSKITVKSVPSSPCNNIPRSQTVPVRKKVQIKSAPLRPPDIGNSSLFPSVEEAALQDAMSPRRSPLMKSNVPSNNKWGQRLNNGASNGDFSGSIVQIDAERDKKLKTLEAKLTGPLGFQQVEGPIANISVRRASLTTELSGTTPTRKTPRSGKLFSELSPERRQKLDELAEKYSKSIDYNQCRSVLDELEFLFQLFNSNNVMKMAKENEVIPLLSSAAEQAYFVIKIVINQLDKLFISMPPSILQLINENYPHKIPKPVRKHIEDWIATQKAVRTKSGIVNDAIPVDFAKTVTFKSDKDGRANFLHQTDFHNFCKQRDLFYAIREVWSSSGGNGGGAPGSDINGGIITDRNRARMSFPPVQHGGSSSSKYVDAFPLKVQSLFQINRNPTNLFHLASLFVSHYLLEARALEVGGVPRDDNMKEFFQSNPMKLLQLNSRFSAASAETLESDQSSSLAFRKQFLLLSSSKFVQHVVDRLVMEITRAEGSLECADLANPGHISRNIKDTIHLSRLLGFAHCLPYLSDDKKQTQAQSVNINSIEKEAVMREQALFRSYQTPPVDLKYFLEKAAKSGRLTASCPWVIEYLLQCDPVALLLPSYQPTLMELIDIYQTILSQHCRSILTRSNKNFLRFYFGQLFSSKSFPDAVFVQLKHRQLTNEKELIQDSSGQELLLDSVEDLGRNMIDFSFEETFNRFKRILSWGKLEVSNTAITGDFRHIRPIPASEKSSVTPNTSKLVCKEKMTQMKLEATFFELYSPSIKRSVDFIAERMASNFTTVAKIQLFPNLRNILSNQGIFGVRAAEKCRVKLTEEMNKYLTEKCCATVKVFLEHAVTGDVLSICQRVAIRKAKEGGAEWIQNYINSGMFPNMLENSETSEPPPPLTTSSQQTSTTTPASPIPNEPEEPPFEILILIHKMLRKLNSQEKVDPSLIDKVLLCQTLSKAPWAFSSLVDWGMSLITYQPQSLSSVRMKQLVSHWKSLWTPNANILNARNLMILTQSSSPRDSWVRLGSITQLLISEGIIKTDNLEQQCFALLREDWPDEMQKRISEYLTIVKEAFQRKAEWNSESGQVLDWVAWLCSGQPDQD